MRLFQAFVMFVWLGGLPASPWTINEAATDDLF